MSKNYKYNYCKEYQPLSTEKLFHSMENSYLFNYSCDNCVQCGKCHKNKVSN